ncbi:uncharacterized protein SPAPADRAFT_67833 [Spathaspora passalidarum NRRL Y-27907]|uniref:Septation initiation network scaffold protein cdc11 n=1 Tax=Spathaspora passalidarum (strain NRRL Y-27907 / 11-Y1) TaxID=619300 RepID=G3ARW8_SPAPN|nr:uncharacterized protein SPAPADRAFT_67833 [Spathaspora passalidarum NRRL Y-27907]EGW31817.1 hypothetical protein SPAPADRAFT_67833 [Spathaspora passalidarum NRRL Y-27907]
MTSTLRNNTPLSTVVNGDPLKLDSDQENQPPSSDDNVNTIMNEKKFIQQSNVPEPINTNSMLPKPKKAASISNLRPIDEDHELSRQQLSPPQPLLQVPSSSHYSTIPTLSEKPPSPPPVVTADRAAVTSSSQSTFTLKDINLQPEEEQSLPESSQDLSILEQSSPRHSPIKKSAYQAKLRYHLNQDFSANDKSSLFLPPGEYGPTTTKSPPPSIPNTFKYKSHPNAKTKTKIGAEILEEEEEDQHKSTGTADWMPSVLGDRWISETSHMQPTPLSTSNSDPIPSVNSNEFNSSVRITKSQPILLKQPSFATTMIHNSKIDTHETAEWKRAAEEYINKQHQNNFANIFQSIDSTGQKQPVTTTTTTAKSTHSSTLSTPIATLSRQMIPEQQQQQQQEHVEQSPLKLFRKNYDTFTKKALHGLLENLSNKSNVNTPTSGDSKNVQENRPHTVEAVPPPALNIESVRPNSEQHNIPPNIKDFTKDGHYNEAQYMQNANNVFSNLKKGYRASSYNIGQGKSHTTATSTPLTNNVRNIEEEINEYSSFSSGFNSKEDDEHERVPDELGETVHEDVDLYTQESTRSNSTQFENDSQYTFDEDYDDNGTITERTQRLSSPHRIQVNNHGFNNAPSVHYMNLEAENAALKQRIENMTKLQPSQLQPTQQSQHQPQHHEVSIVSDDNDDDNGLVIPKWKNISQLHLEPSPKHSKSQVIKGHVVPDRNLPKEYGNMIFDEKTMKWQEKKNSVHYTLDSIDDLTATQNLTSQPEISSQLHSSPIKKHMSKKTPTKKKRSTNKLEVSFHLPNADLSNAKSSQNASYDVTRMSQLEDMTFTQSHKQLISIINEVLEGEEHWERIKQITLSHFDLENTKDLDQFLPGLQRLDISNNQIQYLSGIPSRILDLDLSNNNISDITSFRDLSDLSMVDLSQNSLVRLNNLSRNIHLSELHLANNSIVSLDGLQELVKLTILDVSGNKLSGKLDFSQFYWPNLQVLNISDNQITSLVGWEEVTDLNVLLANDNQLTNFVAARPNYSLKKLGLKFNNLKAIDIDKLFDLRTLRIDGNQLEHISSLKNLHNIEDISAKSQSPNVLSTIVASTPRVSNLDLSGNGYYFNSPIFQPTPLGAVTKLTLSALGLEVIPSTFATLFPSVIDLNLNFNKLNDISHLASLKLRKLYLVGNELPRKPSISDSLVCTLYNSLRKSRSSLISLDLRMNPLTHDIYPYVISPDELDAPIQIENVEDIDGFLVHYETIKKTSDFVRRDEEFLIKNQTNIVVRRRAEYEMFCVGMFPGMSKLDGGPLTEPKRGELLKSAMVEFARRKQLKGKE